MKTIELTPMQAKFYKAVIDLVANDPELLKFCSSQASGKTTILKLLDQKFDHMSNSTSINKDY